MGLVDDKVEDLVEFAYDIELIVDDVEYVPDRF